MNFLTFGLKQQHPKIDNSSHHCLLGGARPLTFFSLCTQDWLYFWWTSYCLQWAGTESRSRSLGLETVSRPDFDCLGLERKGLIYIPANEISSLSKSCYSHISVNAVAPNQTWYGTVLPCCSIVGLAYTSSWCMYAKFNWVRY